MSYGFCIPNNPHDYVALAVTLGPGGMDPLYHRRLALLQRCTSLWSRLRVDGGVPADRTRVRFFLQRTGLPTWNSDLLAVVRLCAMNDVELGALEAVDAWEEVGGGRSTSGGVPEGLLLAADTESPFVRCALVALHAVQGLLANKLAVASSAAHRVGLGAGEVPRHGVGALFDDAAVPGASHRLACAREYLGGEVSILSTCAQQVQDRIVALHAAVQASYPRVSPPSEAAPALGCLVLIDSSGSGGSRGGGNGGSDSDSSRSSPSWVVATGLGVPAGGQLCSLPGSIVLCRASLAAACPSLCEILDGIEGLDQEAYLALGLLHLAATRVSTPLKDAWGQLLPLDVGVSGRGSGDGDGGGDRRKRRRASGGAPVEAGCGLLGAGDHTALVAQPCGCLPSLAPSVAGDEDGPLPQPWASQVAADALQLYEDLFPALSDAYPKVFPAKVRCQICTFFTFCCACAH